MKSGPGAPRRILMTVDAVGGVWRYALDLAAALRPHGVETVFAGFGPPPSEQQRREAEAIGELSWVELPLEWTAANADELRDVPGEVVSLAHQHRADLLHLNLPSQAVGLRTDVPVVAVSHSCVVTWFRAVQNRDVPEGWEWQRELNRAGFNAANIVVAPSHSHAAMLRDAYGRIDRLQVVHNASRPAAPSGKRKGYVFAAGRWWDEGKNAAVLEAAAEDVAWPIVLAGANTGPNGQYVPLDRIDHRGELPNTEIRALMANAGIVVSPSLYEPFGLAALEAAYAGAPLVLADIPTYRELWDRAALFADPRSPEQFAAALNQLASDPAARALWGERARNRAERFSPAMQANAFLRVYAQAVDHATESNLTVG